MSDTVVPTERIFTNSLGGNAQPPSGTQEFYEYKVRALIDDAIDFEQSYLSNEREDNVAHYHGYLPGLGEGDEYEGDERKSVNRSTFVSTDVRDTILSIMPSLMRIFTATENVGEFVPHTEDGQELADQQYDYINHVLYEDNDGFRIIHDAVKDCLTVRYGIVAWDTDDTYEVQEQEFTDITEEQLQYLVFQAGGDVEIIDPVQDPGTGLIDVTVRYEVPKPLTKVCNVPPDEFRIDRYAKDLESSRLVGWERTVSVSYLVEKGYDAELIAEHISHVETYSDERYMRNPGLQDDSNMMDGVIYGEYFIRVDGDEDGIDELHHICVVGNDKEIIKDQIVPRPKFAMFLSDPTPHTAIGDSMADLVKDIQKFKTNMMRGQLDNLAETLTPRTVVNELLTNIEDVLNDDVGAIIRTKGDPNGAVAFSKTPYAGRDIQDSINYLDSVRASRTGITEASKGLDPDAMQSTALVGINAIISGAQERIELIARVIAETGIRGLVIGLLHEVTQHPNVSRTLKLRGKWVDVNPSLFDPSLNFKVNSTIGKGTDAVKLQALTDIRMQQKEVMTIMGLNNPWVTPVEFRNTQVDILDIANIKNPSRYFKEPPPEVVEQVMNAPKDPDPATLLAQAEIEKVKKDTLVAANKIEIDQGRLQLEVQKAMESADFNRDKLDVDTAVKIAVALISATGQEHEAEKQSISEENKSGNG